MIRPIKLRAKTKDGEWATGDLCFNDVEPPQIIWVREDSEVIETDIFDHATIGMYTGIKDKNGQEICEDDFVHFVNPRLHYDLIAPVVFENGDFCLLKNVNYLIPMGNFSSEVFEVVGNIFDNPELLKQNKTDGNKRQFRLRKHKGQAPEDSRTCRGRLCRRGRGREKNT